MYNCDSQLCLPWCSGFKYSRHPVKAGTLPGCIGLIKQVLLSAGLVSHGIMRGPCSLEHGGCLKR